MEKVNGESNTKILIFNIANFVSLFCSGNSCFQLERSYLKTESKISKATTQYKPSECACAVMHDVIGSGEIDQSKLDLLYNPLKTINRKKVMCNLRRMII